MSGVEVIRSDLRKHPCCPHGPTLLFSRLVDGQPKNFFSCSACRDRKDCKFFMWENELDKMSEAKKKAWKLEKNKFLEGLNHRKLYVYLNKVRKSLIMNQIKIKIISVGAAGFSKYEVLL